MRRFFPLCCDNVWLVLVLPLIAYLVSRSEAQPYRAAILPFAVSSGENLTHLTEGSYTILASRLFTKDSLIAVVPREEVDKIAESTKEFSGESRALMAGAQLQADYVIYGNIIAGDSLVSVTTACVDVSGRRNPWSERRELPGVENVIPEINRFATAIHDYIISAGNAASPGSAPALPDSVSAADAAPEGASGADSAAPSAASPPKPAQAEKTAQRVWQTQSIPHLINGCAVGDIDGDSLSDLVILTPRSVQVYGLKKDSLIYKSELFKVKSGYPLSIDIADINGNGVPEIFIAALDSYQKQASSAVWERKDGVWVTLVKNFPWYLRVVKNRKGEPVLLAQRHMRNGPYKGDIAVMNYNDGKYVPGNVILSGKKTDINVLGCDYGILRDSNKKPVVLGYEESYTIVAFDPQGRPICESPEPLGGSPYYFRIESSMTYDEDRIYFPVRLVSGDFDHDGTMNILTAKNYDSVKGFLAKIRVYKKCRLEILRWNGTGIVPEWNTQTFAGFVRDFAVADMNNDGKNECIAAVVRREGKFMFTKPQSSVIVVGLE